MVGAHVKELLLTLGPHLDAVAAALELITEGANEFALLIEHKNGRMILQVLPTFMNDVQQALGIHGHIMGGLPCVLGWQLREAVLHLVLVFPFADDHLFGSFVGQQQLWHGDGGCGGGKKLTTGMGCLHG